MADAVPLLIALICLILLSGFFSATETAFSCVNRVKLRTLAINGDKQAQKVLVLAEEKFDRLISTILVGNNIVNITAATISTILFSKIISSSSPVDSSLVSTIVTTVVVLIFGEITPKFLAKTSPEKMAKIFYPIIIFFYWVLYPINLIFSGWKWLIKKIFRFKDDSIVTEEEIMTMVEEAAEDGTLRKEETNLIRSVIEFDDLAVADILVPRVNISAVEVNTPVEEIRKLFEKEGYSRLPVYKDSIDTIIGTIHEKDFFLSYLNGKKDINDILQNALYTTEHVKISILLKQLQKKKVHMAVVLDEYGGTLGICTLEDILEELVGEIWDEHDEEIDYIKNDGENSYVVEGNSRLFDLFDILDLKDEEENFDSATVSGWIIELLGEIPRVGKVYKYKNLQIEVLKSTVKRVLQAKITLLEEDENGEKTEKQDK